MKIEPELHQPRRIGRALLREQALLTRPDDACRPGPIRRQAKRKALGGGDRPRTCRADLMQRLAGHSGGEGGKTASPYPRQGRGGA